MHKICLMITIVLKLLFTININPELDNNYSVIYHGNYYCWKCLIQLDNRQRKKGPPGREKQAAGHYNGLLLAVLLLVVVVGDVDAGGMRCSPGPGRAGRDNQFDSQSVSTRGRAELTGRAELSSVSGKLLGAAVVERVGACVPV